MLNPHVAVVNREMVAVTQPRIKIVYGGRVSTLVYIAITRIFVDERVFMVHMVLSAVFESQIDVEHHRQQEEKQDETG